MPDKAETLAALRAKLSALEAGQGSAGAAYDQPEESSPPCAVTDHAASSEVRESKDSAAAGQEDLEASSKVPSAPDLSPEGAFQRIVRLVGHAPRSSGDLRTRLFKEGYPAASITPAIERARACLLVDDERFAEQYALSRLEKGYGLERVRRELREKGLDPVSYAFWDDISERYDSDTEYERALAFAKQHHASSKHPGRSLYAALLRRGFSGRCAIRVLSELGLGLYD